VGVLQGEPIAVDRRLRRAANLFHELDVGEPIALTQKIYGRKIPEPEIFPPDCLLLAAMPVQNRGEKPSRLPLRCPLVRIVGNAFNEALRERGDLPLPSVELRINFRYHHGRALDSRALLDEVGPQRLQPSAQTFRRSTIVSIVALDR